jgi:hypothetical protein
MIELAAAAWKLDLAQTLQKLHGYGVVTAQALVPDVFTTYHREHVRWRKRALQFWQETRRWAANNQRIAAGVLQRLRLPEVGVPWDSRGGQYFGVVSREVLLTHLIGAETPNWLLKFRRRNGFPKGIMSGDGWDHCLVIPYHDLPGRICGMLLAGHDEEGERQLAYLRIEKLNKPAKRVEAGLAFIENTTLPEHPQFGRTLFAITDPLLALRMQLLHLQMNYNPLPIVATYDTPRERTETTWQTIRRDRVVCWAPEDRLAGLAQARYAGGEIAELDSSIGTIVHDLYSHTSGGMLQRAARRAVPWELGLRHYLDGKSHDDVESVLVRVELSNEQMAEFALGCNKALRSRLETAYEDSATVRRLRFNGRTVSQQNNTWTYNKGELLCNATLQIERVITSQPGRTYYQGKIYFREHEIPFLEQAKTLENRGFAWMFDYVRDVANAGTISYSPIWRKHLVGLSIIFHEPEQVRGADGVGWDIERQVVQFPDFALTAKGDVDPKSQCLVRTTQLPGSHLVAPEMFFPRRLSELLSADNEEVRLVWATTAAVLAGLLSPIANRKPRGVLLDGEGATTIGEAAAVLLGCPELVRSSENLVTFVQEKLTSHTWPAVLRAAPGKTLEPGRWLEIEDAGRLVVSLPPIANQVLGLRQTWHVIRGARPLGSLQLTNEAVPYLVPYYLQDWLRRRPDAPAELPELLEDLADWFDRQSGDKARVRSAGAVLEPAGRTDLSRFLVNLVAYALNLGTVRLGREENGFEGEVMYLADQQSVWMAQTPLSDTAAQYGGLPLDVLLVTKLLAGAGALREENRRRGVLGWQIDREWWDTCWKTLAKQE